MGTTVNRRSLILGSLSLLALRPTRLGAAQSAESGTISVPLDHERPDAGSFELRYERARASAPGAPTALVVADGQQFYTRPGAAARLQEELFGTGFDVLVPFGRGREPAVKERLTGSGTTDWSLAHQLLKRDQWLADLNWLVRALHLRERPLNLYGRSGGAYLIYEWLVSDPEAADRVYVQAAVNPELDVRWGLGADRTWEELSAGDPALAAALMAGIEGRPERRAAIVRLLQRQNFFVPLEALGSERSALVRAFLAHDERKLAEYRSNYQLDALDALAGTVEGLASAVRLFEFASPRTDPRGHPDRLFPDIELLFDQAGPLIALARAGKIHSPLRDWSTLSRQQAEVLQVAGRHDHTADYRTQIGLEAAVPTGRLLIFRDDHRLTGFSGSGRQPGLIRTFFAEGSASQPFRSEVGALSALLWREHG